MSKNTNLHKAKSEKNDEFYTQLHDIENEIKHYRDHFKGKSVYCNCDDPTISNFTHYFYQNFDKLGLKRLMTTCYKSRDIFSFSNHDSENGATATYTEYTGFELKPKWRALKGDGDFRSRECSTLLMAADIVVTNPPFSLFREYVAQLMEYEKKFIIIEGDFVLDPFCGCATTPVAAERLNRKWVGMDIWDGAGDIVLQRLSKEALVQDGDIPSDMFAHTVHVKTDPPIRTDDAEYAAPELRLRAQRVPEKWERLTHKQIVSHLADAQCKNPTENGIICAGCGRVLELEFMQLDHIMPRIDGGENNITNRILLCGPCNRRKGAKFTLNGLIKENKKKSIDWMKDESLAKKARESARGKSELVRLDG